MQAPIDILKKYWGYDAFRPLQSEIIQSVLENKDTLALMPTGGGKSICFQVPALCREGVCLVISPLIALMRDQVYNLKKRGVAAEAIFSGMHYREIDRILDNAIYGGVKLLYLSPERLANDMARERIRQMQVNLIAVDEAHCISQWGYDFRPPYLKIADIREILPGVPVLALTATATEKVVDDIQDKLQFRNGRVFSKSFVRSNLAYVVLPEENKRNKLLDILKKVKGSGVVYVRNRKGTREVARYLTQNRINADYYHAGLNPEERTVKQESWIKGKTRIMVATNAFGMGIDKPDVRTVVHLDLPDNLEAYFQEAGRAGRDGKKSYAILLYAPVDSMQLERNHALSFPPLSEIKRVYQALGSYYQLATGSGQYQSFDFDIVDFCNNFKLDVLRTFSALKILEQEDWITLTEAVYMPSTFKMLVTREQLYDFQLKQPKLNLVIKTLLRVTESAFQHFARINEHAVARFLKMPVDQLIASIELLAKENIIDYRKTRDKPQLVFNRERVEPGNLTIDMDHYDFLRKRHLHRMQQSIAYATTPKCRSQQLLAYFGEDTETCGTCDVCLGRTSSDLSSQDYTRYKEKIRMLLRREQLSESDLLQAFSSNRHPNVLNTLSHLLDEGIVNRVADKLVWKG